MHFFVEGATDAELIRAVVLPRLGIVNTSEQDLAVETYASRDPKKNAGVFCTLLKQGYDCYILADLDTSACITDAKTRLLKTNFVFTGRQRPADLQRRIIIVCPEIEAWYLAGLPPDNILNFSVASHTDAVTKERFKNLCQQHGVDYWVALRQILKEYDWNLAKTRNRSLNYFATRLGL